MNILNLSTNFMAKNNLENCTPGNKNVWEIPSTGLVFLNLQKRMLNYFLYNGEKYNLWCSNHYTHVFKNKQKLCSSIETVNIQFLKTFLRFSFLFPLFFLSLLLSGSNQADFAVIALFNTYGVKWQPYRH